MYQAIKNPFLAKDIGLRPLLGHFATPCVVIVVGIFISIMAFVGALHQTNDRLEEAFLQYADHQISELDYHLTTTIRDLRIVQAGLSGKEERSAADVDSLLQPLLARGVYSALATATPDTGSEPQVTYQFLAQSQSDTANRDLMETLNAMLADPDIQSTDKIRISQPFQRKSVPGSPVEFAFFIPVNSQGQHHIEIAVLDLNKVLASEMDWTNINRIAEVEIYDLATSSTKPILTTQPGGIRFPVNASSYEAARNGFSPYALTRTRQFLNRDLRLTFHPTRAYLADAAGPLSWLILFLGLALTTAVGYLSFSAITRNLAIERKVGEQTAKLGSMANNLSDSNKRLSAILDNTVDGMITIDQTGHIESYNSACETIFGYKFDEVVSQNIKMLMPEPYQSEHDQYLKNYMTTHQAKIIGIGREVRGRRKDGSIFPIELAVSEVNLGDRRIFSGIVRDVSERKEAEAQIQKTAAALSASNKELEQFAYVASHDLKAPLRAIEQLSSWIAEDLGDGLDGENKENMDLLQGRVRRMQTLLDDLLAYSRAGRDFQDKKNQVMSGAEMFDDILQLLNPPDEFSVTATEGFKAIKLPKLPLHQAVLNLVNNAIKHHDRPSGSITIDAQDAGPFWQISVSDDGPGIKKEYHEKVFDMFQTLQSRDRKEGSGMGLALVKKIAASVGGTIALASDPDVRGCTFTLTWPKTPPGEVRACGSSKAPPASAQTSRGCPVAQEQRS